MIKKNNFSTPTIPIIVVTIAFIIVTLLWGLGKRLGFILPSVLIALIITGIHDWLGSNIVWFSRRGIIRAFIFVLVSMLCHFFIH